MLPERIRRLPARACLAVLMMVAGALVPAPVHAQDLAVAAASDLQSVMPEVVDRFQKDTGRRVAITFGSSGTFSSQIQNGAPFDVFFSADVDYTTQLEKGGFAEPGSQYRYAIGRIVLWTRKDSGIDIRPGLSVLKDPRVRRVSIANPEHAPYGRAAIAALAHEQLDAVVKPKLVLGENISQAAQFAQSGNADAGIIALSLARSAPLVAAGSFVEIPESFHARIEQAAVVVRASKQKPLARQFLSYLQRPDIQKLFQNAGFVTP